MEYLLVYMLFINIVGIFFGWLLTENNRWSLTRISPFFDRKPFNCRPCLTFHLLWIMYVLVAFVTGTFWFAVVGLLLSLFVFVGLYFSDRSKIDD